MMRAWLSLTVVAALALATACAAQQEGDAKQHAVGPEDASAKPHKALAPAQQAQQAPGSPSSALNTFHLPSSLSMSNGMVQALAVAGAVVVGLLAVTGVLAVVLPWFSGFRLCYLFNNCETYAHAFAGPAYDYYAPQAAYSAAANTYAKSYDSANNDLQQYYDGYPQHAAQTAYPTTNSLVPNAYQKRSLEYVGPILKLLSNAYEKYSHPAQAKSVVDAKQSASSALSAATAETQAE